jgi:hypothetical protein
MPTLGTTWAVCLEQMKLLWHIGASHYHDDIYLGESLLLKGNVLWTHYFPI